MDIKAIKRLRTLRELARSYEYGQFNLLEGSFDVSYFESADKFIFKNFFSGHYQSNQGTCRELAMKSFNDIKKIFPDIYVTRIFGQDDQFFNTKGWHHWYNILTEYDPKINYKESMDTIIQEFVQKEAIVFDPCFRVAKKFSKTNYKIIEMYDENHELRTITEVNLEKFGLVPLLFNYENQLLTCLHNQPQYNSKLGIYFKKGKAEDGCDINSPFLDSVKDESIKKFVKVFRSKLENLEVQCQRRPQESFQ